MIKYIIKYLAGFNINVFFSWLGKWVRNLLASMNQSITFCSYSALNSTFTYRKYNENTIKSEIIQYN